MAASAFYRVTFGLGLAVFAAAFALGLAQTWRGGAYVPALAYDELGQAREALALGDVDAVTRQLRTYAALQPAKADGWMRLAQFLQSQGDRRGAIEAYERAAAAIPAPAVAYQQLAILYSQDGELERARERGVVAERNGAALPPDVRQALGF
jgi:DNA-binding SARP family transcriptional activator